jgi:hypothetical protein
MRTVPDRSINLDILESSFIQEIFILIIWTKSIKTSAPYNGKGQSLGNIIKKLS